MFYTMKFPKSNIHPFSYVLLIWTFIVTSALPIQNEKLNEPIHWFNGGSFERKCLLFKNPYLSDVNLLIEDDGSVNEKSYVTIPSHKMILSINSPVFENHFNDTKELVNRIFIEQVGPEVFDIVLK